MEYLLKIKILALFGVLALTLICGFFPARMKFFRETGGTGKYLIYYLYTEMSSCMYLCVRMILETPDSDL